MTPCAHDSRPLYERLIGPLREKARDLGYAIGVHGTLKRDIDLIACPWAAGAVDAKTLAVALNAVVAELNNGVAGLAVRPDHRDWWEAGKPGDKPHGRLCWMIHLGGGPYIDLSVMPRGNP